MAVGDKKIKPDIIYGLLNYMSVPLAHEVLMNTKEIPFVWHFKEGPYVCQYRNLWDKLMDLYTLSDGQIYINEECQSWFEQYIPYPNRKLLLFWMEICLPVNILIIISVQNYQRPTEKCIF